MDVDDVWQLVAQARSEADDPEDADAVAARATALLAQQDPAQIVAFEQPFWDLMARSYRADLWAAAYVIRGGCSDDGFDYFRGWLIAQGRDAYETALADPDSLAALPAIVAAAQEDLGDFVECEDMMAAAWTAYRSATGENMPSGSHSIRLPALDPEWDFDFDDREEMSRRLPRLTTLYYG